MKLFRMILTGALFLGIGCGSAMAQPKEPCICPPGKPCDCRNANAAAPKLPPQALPPRAIKPGPHQVPQSIPLTPDARRDMPKQHRPGGRADVEHRRPHRPGDVRDGRPIPQHRMPRPERPNAAPLNSRMNCGFCDDLRRTCKPDDPRCAADFARCKRDCR